VNEREIVYTEIVYIHKIQSGPKPLLQYTASYGIIIITPIRKQYKSTNYLQHNAKNAQVYEVMDMKLDLSPFYVA